MEVGTKKVVAGICGILLGALGIHKFIIGNTIPGVIMLLVTILTCGFGGVIMSLVGFIEGIIYLVTPDAEFEQKYIIGKRGWF